MLRAIAEISEVPVAAYQESGEYAMVEAASANGWLHCRATVLETLTSNRRAGAEMIVTLLDPKRSADHLNPEPAD